MAGQAVRREPETTPAAARSPEPALYTVVDTNTTPPQVVYAPDGKAIIQGGYRDHDLMVDGIRRTFRFEHGKQLQLERRIAHKFLLPGFKVFDHTGRELANLPEQPSGGVVNLTKLDPNQVVARIDELTVEALYIRAARMPGGDQLREDLGRDALVAWVVDTSAALAKRNRGRPETLRAVDAADDTAEMTPAELDRLAAA